MTLTAADLLTVVGAIFGTMLVVGGGALAWLRADIARLDARQRSDGASLRASIASLDERQRSDSVSLRADMAKQSDDFRADLAKQGDDLRADISSLDERQRSDYASLRADVAKLDERQHADAAAINMRLDTLSQTILTSASARGPQADVPTEGAGTAVRAEMASQA